MATVGWIRVLRLASVVTSHFPLGEVPESKRIPPGFSFAFSYFRHNLEDGRSLQVASQCNYAVENKCFEVTGFEAACLQT